MLVAAIERVPDPSDARNKQLHEALYNLLGICFFGGRPELFSPLHAALARLDPRPPELLEIVVKTFGDPVRADAATFACLDRQIDRLRTEPTPARAVRVARAAAYVDRLAGCRPALRRVVDVGRQGGAITSAIEALFLLGNDAYFSGQWDELGIVVGEGLSLCDEYGYRVLSWVGIFLRALGAAARGDGAAASELSDHMTRWGKPRGAGAIQTYASHVRTMLALAQGEYEIAFQHASSISPPGALPSHMPHALWLILDLVEAAIRTNRGGAALAGELADRGVDCLLLGEIGMGNTATTAALACPLTGAPPAATVGRGAGVDTAGLERKRDLVAAAIARHGSPLPPRDALLAVGGLELAALAGAAAEAARRGLPVVLDGYAVSTAALAAVRLDPAIGEALIASHRSAEPGHDLVLRELGLEPLLDLRLRLGEASGALLALPIIAAAGALHAGMATFEGAGVERRI
jgi:hypothetical protein